MNEISNENKEVLEIYKIVEDVITLKKLKRTGWQLRGYKDCESLSDHCFGVIFLTYFFVNIIKSYKIDKLKAINMAIIHELAEAKIGDIPFTAYKYFNNKSQAEITAISDIFGSFPDLNESILKLFLEFEKGETIEAKLVKAMDKLDMLVTALDYEKFGITTLQDFWDNEKNFEFFTFFPEISQFVSFLINERKRILNKKL